MYKSRNERAKNINSHQQIQTLRTSIIFNLLYSFLQFTNFRYLFNLMRCFITSDDIYHKC